MVSYANRSARAALTLTFVLEVGGSPQGKAGVLGGGLSPLIKIKGKKRCFFLNNVHA